MKTERKFNIGFIIAILILFILNMCSNYEYDKLNNKYSYLSGKSQEQEREVYRLFNLNRTDIIVNDCEKEIEIEKLKCNVELLNLSYMYNDQLWQQARLYDDILNNYNK